MDGTFIDVVINKLQWLFEHPEVTWSGSGIYVLSLAGSAVFAVAACVVRRKKISQGDHAIAKKVNNHGPVISTSGNQAPAVNAQTVTITYNNLLPEWMQYAEEFGVTKAAIARFFKILEQEKVPPGDLDSKLREIAFRYKELLLRLETMLHSADPEVAQLKQMARQAIDAGEYAKAEGLLEDVAMQHSIFAAETYTELARLQRVQLRYAKAAMYWEKAAAFLPKGRNKERALCLHSAGYDLYRIAKYKQALFLFEQSLVIFREIGDQKNEGITLNSIGSINSAQGDKAKALQYYEQSLHIMQEIGEKKGEGATLNNTSQIYAARDDYATAMKYLERSLRITQEIGDKAVEGATLNNISRIYKVQSEYATAMKYLEQSLSISQEIGDKVSEADVSGNIGLLYAKQGKLAEAKQYFSRAVELGTQLEHPDLELWRKGLELVRAKLRARQ